MAQHNHQDLKRAYERIRIKQQIAEAMPGINGRGLFAIGEHGTTTWNGGAGGNATVTDRGSAALSGGGIGSVMLSGINTGNYDDYEITTTRLDDRAEARRSMQQAAKLMAAEDKADEEVRKKGRCSQNLNNLFNTRLFL